MTISIFPDKIRIGPTWPVMKTPEFATGEAQSSGRVSVRVPQTQNPIWHWTLIYEGLTDLDQALIDGYQTLQGFYLSRHARFDDFLYFDHSDNTAGPRTWDWKVFRKAGETVIDPAGHLQTVTVGGMAGTGFPVWNDSGGVTTDGQIQYQDGGAFPGSSAQPLSIVTDGKGNFFSPLQRLFGGTFYEDVTDLNLSTIPLRVWNNGTLAVLGTDYFVAGPSLGQPQLVLPNGTTYEGLYLIWGVASTNGWTPGTTLATGYELVDPAGHIQKVTTGGVTSTTVVGLTIPPPTWNDAGGTTSDGSVVWTDQGVSTGPGGPITASFQFYFRATFEDDQQDFEQFISDHWTIGGESGKNGKGYLKIRSSKLPTPQLGASIVIPAAVANPPTGGVLTLFATTPPNPQAAFAFGDLAVSGGQCITSGQSLSYGDGTTDFISLSRFLGRSTDSAASGVISRFTLPSWLSPSRVTAVFAVIAASKFDMRQTPPATPTVQSTLALGQIGCPVAGFTWCNCGGKFVTFGGSPSLIQFHILDGLGGFDFFNTAYSNTYNSYPSIPYPDNVRQLSPSSGPLISGIPVSTMSYASPPATPFATIGMQASLQITNGLRCNDSWDGGLALVVWYN